LATSAGFLLSAVKPAVYLGCSNIILLALRHHQITSHKPQLAPASNKSLKSLGLSPRPRTLHHDGR